jgi:hypothetical protein
MKSVCPFSRPARLPPIGRRAWNAKPEPKAPMVARSLAKRMGTASVGLNDVLLSGDDDIANHTEASSEKALRGQAGAEIRLKMAFLLCRMKG